MNVWRPVIDHVADQLGMGRLCTVEVDSWFLPDTRGVSYGIDHVKSTIVPQMLDREERRLGYFHNAGYFELDGDDFDGVFRLGSHAEATGLPPYVEVVRLDRIRRDDPELVSRVVALTARPPGPAADRQPRHPVGPTPGRGPALVGRPGPRDVPSVLVRNVPPMRGNGRAGGGLRRVVEPLSTAPVPSRPPPTSPSWRPGPRLSSSPWPGWCGAPGRPGRHRWSDGAALGGRYGHPGRSLWRLTPTCSRPRSGSAPRRRPDSAAGPADVTSMPLRWLPAEIPGTAAGALRRAGEPERSTAELDGEDWWFRCRFPARRAGDPCHGPWLLELEGLATISDVWLNGDHVAHSESMFTPVRVRIDALADRQRVGHPVRRPDTGPGRAAPRPRWKTGGATHQNLRWLRTTLLGRQPGWAVTPAPVGPWRPVRLTPWAGHQIVDRRVTTRCTEGGGTTSGSVSVELRVTTDPAAAARSRSRSC